MESPPMSGGEERRRALRVEEAVGEGRCGGGWSPYSAGQALGTAAVGTEVEVNEGSGGRSGGGGGRGRGRRRGGGRGRWRREGWGRGRSAPPWSISPAPPPPSLPPCEIDGAANGGENDDIGDDRRTAPPPPPPPCTRPPVLGDDWMEAMAVAMTEADSPGSLSRLFLGPTSSNSNSLFPPPSHHPTPSCPHRGRQQWREGVEGVMRGGVRHGDGAAMRGGVHVRQSEAVHLVVEAGGGGGGEGGRAIGRGRGGGMGVGGPAGGAPGEGGGGEG